MEITKIELHNICQHSSLVLEVDKGLSALCAPNAFGKTNFLRGVVYGVTGTVDKTWGSQKLLQKRNEISTGYSEITFEYNSDTYILRRYAADSARYPDTLWKNTGEGETETLFEKRSEIDEFIQGITGLPMPLLAQLMWARQGELTWLLTAMSSSVSAFLSSVFDCRKVEKMREALKLGSNNVARLRSDYAERRSAAEKERDALPPELSEFNNSL